MKTIEECNKEYERLHKQQLIAMISMFTWNGVMLISCFIPGWTLWLIALIGWAISLGVMVYCGNNKWKVYD